MENSFVFVRELIIFVVGAFAGAVASLFAEFVRIWWYRPKLKIYGDRPEKNEDFKFSCHSIVVTNLGKTVARNCHGMITFHDLTQEDVLAEHEIIRLADIGASLSKFNIEDEEEFLLTNRDFRKIKNELLAWSRIGNPLNIHIIPNVEALLDICRFMKGHHDKTPLEDQVHISSEVGWKKVRAALKNKHYKITIKIVAENARPVEQDFTIEPSDKWLSLNESSRSAR